MKKVLFSSLVAGLVLAAPMAVLAAEQEAAAPVGGFHLALQLLTLVLVGGILYNLWAGVTGFGGQLGSALKVIGLGVLFLSLETLDQVVETLSGWGSENIFGTGILHDNVHQIVVLIGFFIFALGLSKITKIVKGLKG